MNFDWPYTVCHGRKFKHITKAKRTCIFRMFSIDCLPIAPVVSDPLVNCKNFLVLIRNFTENLIFHINPHMVLHPNPASQLIYNKTQCVIFLQKQHDSEIFVKSATKPVVFITRKAPLGGYFLGVLAHTTALDRLWRGAETLKLQLLEK